MSNEATDELMAISNEIRDQLQFYREMGFEDVGGSGGAAELAPAAASRQPQPQSPTEEVLSRTALSTEADRVEQVDLFGESVAGPRKDPAPKSHSMPVVECSDESLDAIRDEMGDCTRCKLHEHRRTIVFGEGNPQASLMFVGEGPGAEEDATGRPFVGRAGQLLDKIIAAIGLRREDVYIANIV
ncbi:MAG TPA: uracil-DNA glycosylase, partial [Blastocatellia bacterium]|nr:uracil-DNA glycosylase [Blastocatellia bacterium]